MMQDNLIFKITQQSVSILEVTTWLKLFTSLSVIGQGNN